jgi:hypothetical protein
VRAHKADRAHLVSLPQHSKIPRDNGEHAAAAARASTIIHRAATPAPATVGAYLTSLAALGKMLRFNDLPWNPAHRDIQGPLRGVLRTHGRPAQRAAALTLLRRCQVGGEAQPTACD